MPKKWRISLATLLSIAATVTVYQNCAQPPSNLQQASYGDFAFDAKPDTLSYMSCSNMTGQDPAAFYTFRVGAYSTGGMKLTDGFIQGAGRMTTPQKIEYLFGDEKNAFAQLQMSLRSGTDLSIFSTGSSSQTGKDYVSIFPPVASSDLAHALVQLDPGERLRVLPGGLDATNRFQGSLTYADSETLAESVRTNLRQGALLTLNYVSVKQQNQSLALSPGDFLDNPTAADFSKAFGFGYRIGFQQGNVGTGDPARVLSSVAEVDLLSKQETGTQWTCPPNLRFKIVRPEDLGFVKADNTLLVSCDRVLDPQTVTGDLATVRRVLPVEDWYVDMANHCVVPKEGVFGKCYGQDLDIEYGSGSCGGGVACAHFVSVCTSNPQ